MHSAHRCQWRDDISPSLSMSFTDQSSITASTSNISRAASTAYVVLYALAGIAVFIRLLRVKANRFAHVCYLLLALSGSKFSSTISLLTC